MIERERTPAVWNREEVRHEIQQNIRHYVKIKNLNPAEVSYSKIVRVVDPKLHDRLKERRDYMVEAAIKTIDELRERGCISKNFFKSVDEEAVFVGSIIDELVAEELARRKLAKQSVEKK